MSKACGSEKSLLLHHSDNAKISIVGILPKSLQFRNLKDNLNYAFLKM